ncbi:MFS transporter [Streptomyces sp. NBC_00572]|uniref:MFS transporter n=1 Tax=Streptomyces sp. NBC_00572 TaxID=2903664 RepID=UPI00225C0869|nr:MFS transporter [Streptomyces sp. NBC_00572]MCX4986481.1 MFS transporter [Streptomyces sp. NBC_00572]
MNTHQPAQMDADPRGATAEDAPDARRRRTILIAVCIALMAVIASVSGLNVAQPDLAVAFGASQSTILWIINIYTLTLAALLLPLGAIGDRLGRKPTLLTGLAVFGVANVAAALAPSAEVVLAARLLSGVGAAMIMPITLAVITTTFPEEERGRAIGVWTGVAGGGGILGMFLSAALVDVATWRWLFVLPLVLVVVAFAMTLRSVPDSRETSGRSFDTVGALTSVVAVVGLVFVLQEGPERGWTAPATLLGGGVGVLAAVGFVAWELRRRDAALLDVRLFGERSAAGGSITLLALFGVQAGIFVALFPFFQAVLGWSGLLSTLALMPMAVAMMAASGLAPKAVARIGARSTMATGILLAAAGLAFMATFVSVAGGYLSVLPGMLAMGIGMGMAMTPSTEAITGSLPRERQGVASALNDVTREFGTALGVALLGALVSAGYRSTLGTRLEGVPPLDGLPQVAADAAREGVANAVEAANGAGSHAPALIRAAQESFVDGWQQAMWAGVAVMAALFVSILCILARGPKSPGVRVGGRVGGKVGVGVGTPEAPASPPSPGALEAPGTPGTPVADDHSLRSFSESSPEGSIPSA